jgi:putative Ca2+/H+ antiporter (TMEM165/GDT1 family)
MLQQYLLVIIVADKLPISLIHKIGAAIFLVVGISTLVQHYYFA